MCSGQLTKHGGAHGDICEAGRAGDIRIVAISGTYVGHHCCLTGIDTTAHHGSVRCMNVRVNTVTCAVRRVIVGRAGPGRAWWGGVVALIHGIILGMMGRL